MSWTKRIESMRASLYAVAILALAITVMWGGAQFSTTTVEASGGSDAPNAHLMFPGTGPSAIPDNIPAGINVTFNVTGVTGPATDIWISMNLTHSWVGDIDARLTAPNGTTSHVLFASTGATTATGAGDSSDLLGVYRFIDNATGTNWWAAAAAAGAAVPIPAGDYRSTAAGPQPAANFSPPTVITSAFAGIPAINGTWTLNISDNAIGDTGTITAANLAIQGQTTTPVVAAQYLDFFGNNLTDFAIFTFPTAGGQLTYRVTKNDNPTTATSPIIGVPWGQSATDLVPNQGNYIGDVRTDFNVYRNNAGNPANHYLIAQNDEVPGKTRAFIQWGNSTTDIFGAEGDYNGDGLLDPTAIRSTATAGDPLVWFVLNSGTNTVTSFQYGRNSDIALPGTNYTGTINDDPTVIRIGAGGQITWLVGNTTGAVVSATQWGDFDTDFVIPGGDYDGDGLADYMVWRGFGAGTNGVWYLRTATGTTAGIPFGTPGAAGTRDTALRGGDYDGDGRDDIAVWVPATTRFRVLRSTNGGVITQLVAGPAGNTNLPIAQFGTF